MRSPSAEMTADIRAKPAFWAILTGTAAASGIAVEAHRGNPYADQRPDRAEVLRRDDETDG
jgi:hypothetical protein